MKLLSTIILILSIILFPPAALAVVSNNAVLGDATYPIKRVLESGIYVVASLNPTTRAWFSTTRSDRRFKEVKILVAKGQSASQTINELVSQTEIAAEQIDQISNQEEKEKFVKELVVSIQKYDQGLTQILQEPSPSGPSQITQAQPAPAISTPEPVVSVTTPEPAVPTPATMPKSVQTSAPKPTTTSNVTPKVVSTSAPASQLTPSPSPTPVAVVSPTSGNDQAAEDARKKLKEIEDELKKKHNLKFDTKNDNERKFQQEERNKNSDGEKSRGIVRESRNENSENNKKSESKGLNIDINRE